MGKGLRSLDILGWLSEVELWKLIGFLLVYCLLGFVTAGFLAAIENYVMGSLIGRILVFLGWPLLWGLVILIAMWDVLIVLIARCVSCFEWTCDFGNDQPQPRTTAERFFNAPIYTEDLHLGPNLHNHPSQPPIKWEG